MYDIFCKCMLMRIRLGRLPNYILAAFFPFFLAIAFTPADTERISVIFPYSFNYLLVTLYASIIQELTVDPFYPTNSGGLFLQHPFSILSNPFGYDELYVLWMYLKV